MTILNFSKTRICYWNNALTNTSDAEPNINIITPETDAATSPYGVAEIVGSNFNWFHIPSNHYGLYCTTAEMQDLFASSRTITPISAKITIGHCIPLAQYPGSTNTLQLSFNNTIYSKTYHQHASARLTPTNDFETIGHAYNFFRTFDGHRYIAAIGPANITRQELPRPNIRFIYPKPDYVNASQTTNNRANGYAREITLVKGITDDVTAADITAFLARTTDYSSFRAYQHSTVDQPLLEADLANLYAPEFLQDDKNLKALYPGENIDEIEIKPKPSLTHTIMNGEQLLNQLWMNRDVRAIFSNSNFTYNDAVYLYLNLWPQCKGPNSNWNKDANYNINENPLQYICENNNNTTAYNIQNIGFVESFMRLLTGFQYKDQWNDAIPHLWIKGNEVLDPAGALVNHTFQGTVNWYLTIEVEDKLYRPIRDPWKWGNVYRIAQRVIIPGDTPANDKSTVRVKYVKGNPVCGQSDGLLYETPVLCRDTLETTFTDFATENQDIRIIANDGSNFNSTLPSDPESTSVRWRSMISNLPTTSLIIEGGTGGGPSLNTRAKRKARLASVTPIGKS